MVQKSSTIENPITPSSSLLSDVHTYLNFLALNPSEHAIPVNRLPCGTRIVHSLFPTLAASDLDLYELGFRSTKSVKLSMSWLSSHSCSHVFSVIAPEFGIGSYSTHAFVTRRSRLSQRNKLVRSRSRLFTQVPPTSSEFVPSGQIVLFQITPSRLEADKFNAP